MVYNPLLGNEEEDDFEEEDLAEEDCGESLK